MSNAQIPESIRPLLDGYTQSIRGALADRIGGIYLVGSIVLDDFHLTSSDVDFVTFFSRPAASQEIEILTKIHREIDNRYGRPKLEGMYLLTQHLGCRDGDCPPYLNYHDRRLYERHQMMLGAVTWWELKHCGITLMGPQAQTLTIPIDIPYLLETQRQNLNSFWASYLHKPRRMLALLTNWGIHWAVLGVSRQYYTLREGAITSKTRSGEYALEHVPQEYHSILREAISIRKDLPDSLYRSSVKRAVEAYKYIQYIIERVNSWLGKTERPNN